MNSTFKDFILYAIFFGLGMLFYGIIKHKADVIHTNELVFRTDTVSVIDTVVVKDTVYQSVSVPVPVPEVVKVTQLDTIRLYKDTVTVNDLPISYETLVRGHLISQSFSYLPQYHLRTITVREYHPVRVPADKSRLQLSVFAGPALTLQGPTGLAVGIGISYRIRR